MIDVSKTSCSTNRVQFGIGDALLTLAFIIAISLSASCSADRRPENKSWATIPAGTYRIGNPEFPAIPMDSVETQRFWMQRTEVTVGQFLRFLNNTRPDPHFSSPQISFERGRYRAQVHSRFPVAYVDLEHAQAYADWMSTRRRGTYRLPSAAEWQIAASGGREGIRFPWGWAPAGGRARFDANGPEIVARFAPNPFGLYDMAGNVAEWCLPADDDSDTAPALGGSWAERDADLLRIYHHLEFPIHYRDADVGFRLIRY